MGQNGLSPTSFCNYIDCPKKYYYTRVLKVDESESIDEDLDASQLGDCIHKVLENIYGPLNSPLNGEVLKEALDHLPQLYGRSLQRPLLGRPQHRRAQPVPLFGGGSAAEAYPQERDTPLERGERLISRAWEETIHDYPITPEVNLKGTIDRVDILDGTLRIIDYKTGSLAKDEITYDESKEAMPGKWLQLMWYALLYPSLPTHSPLHHSQGRASTPCATCAPTSSWPPGTTTSLKVTAEQLDSFEEPAARESRGTDEPSNALHSPPRRGRACAFCPGEELLRSIVCRQIGFFFSNPKKYPIFAS